MVSVFRYSSDCLFVFSVPPKQTRLSSSHFNPNFHTLNRIFCPIDARLSKAIIISQVL